MTGFFLQKRYCTFHIVREYPPATLTQAAATCILEGIFMIQSSPLPGMSHMREYAELLVHQYITPHLQACLQEICYL